MRLSTFPMVSAACLLAALPFLAEPRAELPLHVAIPSSLVRQFGSEVGWRAKTRQLPCPSGTLPDGIVCVRIPSAAGDNMEAEPFENIHRERSGRWTTYEQIPRKPDRPADYDAYRYPIPPGLPGGRSVQSGYDLDLPNELQRRGPTLRATGHGGVDLPQAKGTPVELLVLDHQRDEADVVYAGDLFGSTVVTRHFVSEGGQLREYLLLHGHLDTISPGVTKGVRLQRGAILGTVGNTGSPELVHLHLEARRVRAGMDVMSEKVTKLGPGYLLASEVSIVCDPRNILPMRP